MKKTIWLNPPLMNLLGELEDASNPKDRRSGKFSRCLGDIVERYDVIMKLTPVPDLTDDEKMIIGEVFCGSVISPLTINRIDESIMYCATGTEAERQALAKKVASWSVAERMAVIESLGI